MCACVHAQAHLVDAQERVEAQERARRQQYEQIAARSKILSLRDLLRR